MRGSLIDRQCHRRFAGIIPAHAGLTDTGRERGRDGRDHPRACGAHSFTVSAPVGAAGSSPRMRGSPSLKQLQSFLPGIIPAHAGLTSHSLEACIRAWDHPRACGAHTVLATLILVLRGSSPRMRGSLAMYINSFRILGIIPAHAGLTPSSPQMAAVPWDHPRACGAHSRALYSDNASQGSSPRMRGSQAPGHRARYRGRIIPAHAGLTQNQDEARRLGRDHPRACGAHSTASSSCLRTSGSSPRMRGSPPRCILLPSPRGIIPAHAGLTGPGQGRRRSRWDHPRACGAHRSPSA